MGAGGFGGGGLGQTPGATLGFGTLGAPGAGLGGGGLGQNTGMGMMGAGGFA